MISASWGCPPPLTVNWAMRKMATAEVSASVQLAGCMPRAAYSPGILVGSVRAWLM